MNHAEALKHIEKLEIDAEHSKRTTNIISNALSHTERELSIWRSKASTLENQLRIAQMDLAEANNPKEVE